MTRDVFARFVLAACLVPAWAASGVAAQDAVEEEAFDRTPQACVIVANIDRTRAIDDQNLIFHMRGRRVYRNHLPRKCPGLARENRIAYETRIGRLCSIDTITVLERLGVDFTPGFTCPLGEFVPLSPEEVEDLESVVEGQRRSQSAIETTSIELEEADAAEPPPAPDGAGAEESPGEHED